MSMGEQFKKKHISAGLLAHVDAGKTTLSEALLYVSGAKRTLGRVDHGDAHLDTHNLERARGITIFSKQALLETQNHKITLVDTPGHVDFSAEAERTNQNTCNQICRNGRQLQRLERTGHQQTEKQCDRNRQ